MLRLLARYRGVVVGASIFLALSWSLSYLFTAGAVSVSGPWSGDKQQNNQAHSGNSFFGNQAISVGHAQDNTGNIGVNRGINQDDSANAGNQVSGQHKVIKTQINNQALHQSGNGASGSGNSATFIGAFQGNSGNSGLNFGNNQDNAGNFGNQVNNQGNIIGTQVNKQGSSVVNDGNIIQHQINYVQLVPGLSVYVSVRPKLQFAISIGN